MLSSPRVSSVVKKSTYPPGKRPRGPFVSELYGNCSYIMSRVYASGFHVGQRNQEFGNHFGPTTTSLRMYELPPGLNSLACERSPHRLCYGKTEEQ